MRRGRLARTTVALAVAATVGVVGPGNRTSRSDATAPSSPSYVLASTPPNGRLNFPGWSHVIAIARADDGSFLVDLDQTLPTGVQTAIGVAKLHADATLDTTFGANGPTPGIVQVESGANLAAQPTTPVIPLPDGHFFVGTRRYLPDGSVDAAFGGNGFMTTNPAGTFSTTWAAIFRTSTGRVIAATDGLTTGCTLYRVGPNGVFDQSVVLPAHCPSAAPAAFPGGDTMLAIVNVPTVELVFIRPDGTLDVNRGGGTGIVTTSLSTNQIVTADVASDGWARIVMTPGLGQAILAFVRPDGTSPDIRFLLDGDVTSIHIDDAFRTVVNYSGTFLGQHPARPTLARYTGGVLDRSFNAGGSTPGLLDTVDLGFTDTALTSPHLALADGRILLPFNPAAGASILVLVPNPPLPPPLTLNGAATATQTAQRGQRYFSP